MIYQIKNNDLEITLSDSGAEMTQVCSKEGCNYLWHGDAKYWNRHAPVLFPIVGKVVGGSYIHQGHTYQLSQHGFARDSVFKVEEQTENTISFILESNEKTRERYPFEFSLRIRYSLEGTQLRIGYEVQNKDETTICFAIGGHPAFNCPLFEDETMEDYYLEFEVAEKTKSLKVTEEVLLSGEMGDFETQRIPLSREYFKNGVTILTELKSNWIALKSHKNSHSVKMNFEGFPFLGIWSPEKGAPFVCIEPWIGHTDYVDASNVLMNKKDFIHLNRKESFKCMYSLKFE